MRVGGRGTWYRLHIRSVKGREGRSRRSSNVSLAGSRRANPGSRQPGSAGQLETKRKNREASGAAAPGGAPPADSAPEGAQAPAGGPRGSPTSQRGRPPAPRPSLKGRETTPKSTCRRGRTGIDVYSDVFTPRNSITLNLARPLEYRATAELKL